MIDGSTYMKNIANYRNKSTDHRSDQSLTMIVKFSRYSEIVGSNCLLCSQLKAACDAAVKSSDLYS